MSIFNRKPKHSVCSDCGIHFEPVTGEINKLFADKCGIHRRPLVEREVKIREVEKWARQNWETLYPKYEKDKKKQDEAYAKSLSNWIGTRATPSCGCQHNNLFMQSGMF